MKLSEAFDLYKYNYMFFKSQSKRVLQNHEYVKNRLVNLLGDKDVAQLTLDDIQEWTSYLLDGRQWNTVRNDIVRLRSVLKYLKDREEKCLNPNLIPVPKRRDITRDYLTAIEVSRMIETACNLRSKFIISFLYSSGVRLSEFLSLNRQDIVDRRFQVVGKGGKARVCFIDERTEQLMNEYLSYRDDDCEALVVSRLNKERMTPTNVQLAVKNAAHNAGIDKHVTPHVFRHSFATNFLANNGNIRYLSALLGHASVQTTMVYTHVIDNDLERQYLQFHTI